MQFLNFELEVPDFGIQLSDRFHREVDVAPRGRRSSSKPRPSFLVFWR
jgi:hypothetical protein